MLSKKEFISRVIFNYLIGNGDAHGKNFSLLYADNKIFFSPAYDILCTMVYELEHDMAMKIGKAVYISEVKEKDWEIFSKDMEISFSIVKEELQRQIKLFPEALKKVIEKTDAEIGNEIRSFVLKNCENTKKRINL